MKSSASYRLWKENNWGDPRWVLSEVNSSPFGEYDTKAEALKDARKYGINVKNITVINKR